MYSRKITTSEINAKSYNSINSFADKQLQAFVITAYHMLRLLKLNITQNGILVHKQDCNKQFELYIEIDKFDIIPVSQFETVLSKVLTDELLDIMNKKNQSKHCLYYYPNVSIMASHVVDNTYYINMVCSSS